MRVRVWVGLPGVEGGGEGVGVEAGRREAWLAELSRGVVCLRRGGRG